MDAFETGLLTRHPSVVRRPLTVAEFHRMLEVGILLEDDRVELVEGELAPHPGSRQGVLEVGPGVLGVAGRRDARGEQQPGRRAPG